MTTLSRIHETHSDQDFDDVQVAPTHQTPTLNPINENLVSNTSGYTKWLVILGVLSVLGFGVMDLVLYAQAHFDSHPVMTSSLIIITLAFFLLLAMMIQREIRAYQRLKIVESQQQALDSALQHQDKAALIALLKIRTPQYSMGLAAQLHKRFWHTVQAHHSSDDIWQLYQQIVLTPLKEKAEAQIAQATMQSSAISLLSPNDLIHTSVLLWRSMKLVKDLALIYGIRPGVYGNVHLLKLSLQHALIQQGSDLLLEASLKQLSEHLLAKIAEKGAQAATTGFLVRRLGMATIDMLSVKYHVSHLESRR